MHGYSSIATCTMHMLNGTANKQSMLQMSKVIHNGITILLKMKIEILLSNREFGLTPSNPPGHRPGMSE